MILVRHAESEWNRLFSRTESTRDPDPPLTATGRRRRDWPIGWLRPTSNGW